MNWLSKPGVLVLLLLSTINAGASFPYKHKRYISSHQVFNIWADKFLLNTLENQQIEERSCRHMNDKNFKLIGGKSEGVDQSSIQDPGSIFITWYYKCTELISNLFIRKLEESQKWDLLFKQDKAPQIYKRFSDPVELKNFFNELTWLDLNTADQKELVSSSIFYLLGPQYIGRSVERRLQKHLSKIFQKKKVREVLVEALIFISIQEEYLTY